GGAIRWVTGPRRKRRKPTSRWRGATTRPARSTSARGRNSGSSLRALGDLRRHPGRAKARAGIHSSAYSLQSGSRIAPVGASGMTIFVRLPLRLLGLRLLLEEFLLDVLVDAHQPLLGALRALLGALGPILIV